MGNKTFNVLIIGGGINGLCAAYHLRQLGVKQVGLVEQFSLGHDKGSSHGTSRITRSTYAKSEYVRLMRWVHREEWPALEKDTGQSLIYPNPGLFIGPPCPSFNNYIQAVEKEDVDVHVLSTTKARQLYPQFTFKDTEKVLLDKTGGIILAQETIKSLTDLVHKNKVSLYENTPVHEIHPSANPLVIKTSQGILKAESLIVTAGAWTRNLLPFLKPHLRVIRQTVGYFTPGTHRDQYQPGPFPVWAYISDNHFFYGIPELGHSGIKVAHHLLEGNDNPDENPQDSVRQEKIEELNRFMNTFFTSSKWTLSGTEHCLYTYAPNENFIIDRHPQNPRIIIGCGFSGHGFKFGPFTGRLLAELANEGRIPSDREAIAKSLFSLPKSNSHR